MIYITIHSTLQSESKMVHEGVVLFYQSFLSLFKMDFICSHQLAQVYIFIRKIFRFPYEYSHCASIECEIKGTAILIFVIF